MVKKSEDCRRRFRVRSGGPRRLTLTSQANSAAPRRLHESAIPARFKFSPKIQAVTTFDFCNSIGTNRTNRAGPATSVSGQNRKKSVTGQSVVIDPQPTHLIPDVRVVTDELATGSAILLS